MNITHVHASLKHNAPAGPVAAWLGRLVRGNKAQILTCTEAQQHGILARVRGELGPGWTVLKRGEYLIAWDKQIGTGGVGHLWNVSNLAGLIGWRQMHVFAKVIKTTSGTRLRVCCFHAPSGVQDGDRWSTNTKQVKAHQHGFATLGRKVRRSYRTHREVQVPCGDFNKDQHRPVWMTWDEAQLGAVSCWRGRQPSTGTHGPRLIDAIHILGGTVTSAWLPAANASRPAAIDHKAIAATYRI